MSNKEHKRHGASDDVWIAMESRSRKGKVYYFNRKTRETTWTKPKSCIIPNPSGSGTSTQMKKASHKSSSKATSSSQETNLKGATKPLHQTTNVSDSERAILKANRRRAKGSGQDSTHADRNAVEIMNRPKTDSTKSKSTNASTQVTVSAPVTSSTSGVPKFVAFKPKSVQLPKLTAGNVFGAVDSDEKQSESSSSKTKAKTENSSLSQSSTNLHSNVPFGSSLVTPGAVPSDKGNDGLNYPYKENRRALRVSPALNRQNVDSKLQSCQSLPSSTPYLKRPADMGCIKPSTGPFRQLSEERRGLAKDRMTRLRQRLSEEVVEKEKAHNETSPKPLQVFTDRAKKVSPKKEPLRSSRKRAISPESRNLAGQWDTAEKIAPSSVEPAIKEKSLISSESRTLAVQGDMAKKITASPVEAKIKDERSILPESRTVAAQGDTAKKTVSSPVEPKIKQNSFNERLIQFSPKKTSRVPAPEENKVSREILSKPQTDKIIPENEILEASKQDFEPEAMDIDEQAQLISDIKALRSSCNDWNVFGKEPEWTAMETDFWVVDASPQSSVVIVLDTNILLSHLNFVRELRDTAKIDGEYPILYLPWMVIQELDRLKDRGSSGVTKSARSAVSFLNENFKSKHTRFRGQTGREASRARGSSLEERCADDSILESCLQMKQQGFQIILLSNDVNLCTKALMNEIEAMNRYQLSNKMVRTKEKTSTILSDLLPSTGKQDSVMSRLSQHVQTQEKRDVQETKTGISENLEEMILKTFSSVISKGMEAEYGSLWPKRVLHKPPWKIDAALTCIAHHWFALCDRSTPESVRNAVNTLKRSFKKIKENSGKIEEICALALEICNQLDCKYDEIVKPLELSIKNIHSRSATNETSSFKNDVHSSGGMQGNILESPGVSNELPQNLPPSCNLVMTYFQSLWNIVYAFCLELKAKFESGIPLDHDTKMRSKEILDGINEIASHINRILAVPEENITASYPGLQGILDLLRSVTIPAGTSPLQLQDVFIFCTHPDCRNSLGNGLAQLNECGEVLLAAINAGN